MAPSTPQSRFLQAAVSTPSPGSWKHPKFDEIAQRQKASTFDDGSLRRIAWNGGALAFLIYSPNFLSSFPGHETLRPFSAIVYWAFWVLGLYNIIRAILPLLQKKDELIDIPLTPTQRSLLGLDPRATPPPTPETKYVTPPRFPRSPTPRNISPASRNNSAYSTPISNSPSFSRERSDSPMGSPWGQKSMSRTRDSVRRSSYSSPSPLGPGFGRAGSILGAPSTPSPSAGKGASVGLNSKWLYNKGRSSSGSKGTYSGSVLG